ncbi:peptidoglycan glycosyltransferase/peptidoglycan DD-transpeptidase MrcA [Tatumella sp. OPLPL6]|uniref:peptidoglycan glycosyltransferase/peptidoglycan DD-transpeptidase MrcA n=1 Tax=Tatumella sp. OPLPL6 TaxID=1928657 RepID=UPI000C1A0208|nr:peptidoglycan glycosyltransferase/peptidoglycan DD-transpeptidase MrcA [Tatumella sp. OPLPL6]PIJ43830.1 carboxypeptidase/penicillin-binding protein 1A [Tatumella sp. OPLPL6]
MKFLKYLFILFICCIFLGVGSIYGLYKYIEPQLPDVNTLKDVKMQTPMQVYSADGELIAQFGEKRRIPLTLQQMPPDLIHAFIATEDSRFYEHHGVDPIGIFRAASIALFSGRASQGASTITQQLARNFFLSPEKTLLRKIREAFLAIRIEQLFSKDQILDLYLNKIYLGSRAYGVGAAAHVYFGKDISELSLSQMAMIAGLPKAPSTFNPLYSHTRALARRNVVLGRMLDQKYISQQQYEQAVNEPLISQYHGPQVAFTAPYVSEMVRQEMVKRYGEDAYNDGYQVTTTITRTLQEGAQQAVVTNVLNYDIRHGYRGPTKVLWHDGQSAWDNKKIDQTLANYPTYGPLIPAVVQQVNGNTAQVRLKNATEQTLSLAGVRWARPFKNDNLQGATPRSVSQVLATGQLIWVRAVGQEWWLAQVPQVNSALVSLDSHNGAIKALVGGFDFSQSMFNRATQALRQVGSNIKPFLYTAAMDKGLTLATILNDLPISRWDAGAGSDWRPHNSPNVYAGPMRLRQGLGLSKNVVMVRAMRAMGVDYAAKYLLRFGFPEQNIIHTESLALGAASFTPIQVARGYAILTNGGFQVEPWLISKISDQQGTVLFQENPKVACPECNSPTLYANTQDVARLDDSQTENVAHAEQPVPNGAPQTDLQTVNKDSNTDPYAPHVISTPLSFLIKSAMNSNIFGEPGWQGTGWRAGRDLQRNDIGGKTGTTNSSRDAWFSGYGPGIATSVWIGFDNPSHALGRTTASGAIADQVSGYEGGAKSAQPAWDDYMKVALQGVPLQPLTPPEGITTVTIDRTTGKLSHGGGNSRPEYFITGTEPKEYSVQETSTTIGTGAESQDLF